MFSSMMSSTLKDCLHFSQSTVKSVNSSTCPDAFKTSNIVIVGVLISIQLSFNKYIFLHRFSIFCFNLEPRGP